MTRAEIVERLKRLNPDAKPDQIDEYAKAVEERLPLMEAALNAGMRQGQDLRERWLYGKGWWWEEMAPLHPGERTWVLEQVKTLLDLHERDA